MEDTESFCSRAWDFMPADNRKQSHKVDVYNQVLHRLRDLSIPETELPGFEDELWAHFHRLPARYALDVNAERAQDVLMHKRLLQMARDPATRHAIEVRVVQGNFATSGNLSSQRIGDAQCSYNSSKNAHPPPAFASSCDVELPVEVNHLHVQDRQNGMTENPPFSRAMHEITISTNDKRKIFSQLASLLSEVNLNIQEAHAFSTIDGYSLDVFVVDGWPLEETERLRNTLAKKLQKIEKQPSLKWHWSPAAGKQEQTGIKSLSENLNGCTSRINDWEIDTSLLKYERKIASVSFCDLYKGTFRNQDVAIKVLRAEHINQNVQREFTQEVYIMRNIWHKNVVQFIGACTSPPRLCLVTEYMYGGSMYDFLHKENGVLPLSSLIRVAIDVSEGMNYLHQNSIMHRDLKAANILIDGSGVVKVADFGVARMQAQSGVMTAETGTYRWMAPELIEHKAYNHKVDVFSFGVLLWELLTGKLPYEDMTPLQAAVGVVQKGLRPTIPTYTHPTLVELIERCWQQDPSLRPEFSEVVKILQDMAKKG